MFCPALLHFLFPDNEVSVLTSSTALLYFVTLQCAFLSPFSVVLFWLLTASSASLAMLSIHFFLSAFISFIFLFTSLYFPLYLALSFVFTCSDRVLRILFISSFWPCRIHDFLLIHGFLFCPGSVGLPWASSAASLYAFSINSQSPSSSSVTSCPSYSSTWYLFLRVMDNALLMPSFLRFAVSHSTYDLARKTSGGGKEGTVYKGSSVLYFLRISCFLLLPKKWCYEVSS